MNWRRHGNRRRGKGLALFLGALAVGTAAVDWHGLPPGDFARRPELQALVAGESFDRGLMETAIFHETNRVRRRLGLPLFSHLAKLDEVADLKTVVGVVQSSLTHDNPLPLTATLADRAKQVGLEYRELAENIARVGVFDVPLADTPVAVRTRDGRRLYLRLDTGAVVPHRTYAQLAAAVVQGWMDSPPHRAHIVNPRLSALGCAARPCPSPNGEHEQIYAVQVFLRPK